METGKDPGTLLKVLKVQGRASSIKQLVLLTKDRKGLRA